MALDLQDGDLVEVVATGRLQRTDDYWCIFYGEKANEYLTFEEWDFTEGPWDVRTILRKPRAVKVGHIVTAQQVADLKPGSVIQSVLVPKFILVRTCPDTYGDSLWFSAYANEFHDQGEVANEEEAEYRIIFLPEH